MANQRPYDLIYDPDIVRHLATIESKYHSLIGSSIDEQLRFEPLTPTRNRKPLMRPIELGAKWELRIGPQNQFRVFYRVDVEVRQVHILAIGVKDRERLWIAGEEVA